MKTAADKVAEANNWTWAFSAGYLDGKTQAAAPIAPDNGIWRSLDEYAYGYRSGYHAGWQGTSAEMETIRRQAEGN